MERNQDRPRAINEQSEFNPICPPRFWNSDLCSAAASTLRAQNVSDDPCHPLPLIGLFCQPPAPQFCKPVVLGAAVILTLAPFAGDGALMLEAIKRGIERSLLDGQSFPGDLL